MWVCIGGSCEPVYRLGLGSGFECVDVGVFPREFGPRKGGISGIDIWRTPRGVGLRCWGVISMLPISSLIARCMYSSYACASGVCRRGPCGLGGEGVAGFARPLFIGGENTLGTGDVRRGSCLGGGKKGAFFLSGDGGSGTLEAVLSDVVGDAPVHNGASRFVGEGGGLARMVSSFSS